MQLQGNTGIITYLNNIFNKKCWYHYRKYGIIYDDKKYGEMNILLNIIFDIGEVLVDFSWSVLMKRLFDEETALRVTEATWKNPDWIEFDKGNLTDEEVLKLLIKKAPDLEMEIRTAFSRIGEVLTKKETTIPLIKRLKSEGYGVYYLSNYFEFLMHAAPQPLDFIPYTDGGIFSCHEHLVKPDREIYLRLCSRYGLSPEECIFIDDREKNVRGAESAGMKGIVYTGQTPDELCGEIYRRVANPT